MVSFYSNFLSLLIAWIVSAVFFHFVQFKIPSMYFLIKFYLRYGHHPALLVKFMMVFIVSYLVMGLLFGISLGNIFTLSLYLGIVAYLLGDLVVLPMRGNLIATVADFGLALIGIWLLSYYIARP